jgi:hypothetical protein
VGGGWEVWFEHVHKSCNPWVGGGWAALSGACSWDRLHTILGAWRCSSIALSTSGGSPYLSVGVSTCRRMVEGWGITEKGKEVRSSRTRTRNNKKEVGRIWFHTFLSCNAWGKHWSPEDEARAWINSTMTVAVVARATPLQYWTPRPPYRWHHPIWPHAPLWQRPSRPHPGGTIDNAAQCSWCFAHRVWHAWSQPSIPQLLGIGGGEGIGAPAMARTTAIVQTRMTT